MNVQCPSCATVYRVDPSKVTGGGVRARCAVCSRVFAVDGTGGREVAQPAMAAPTPAAPVFTPVPAGAAAQPVRVAAPAAPPALPPAGRPGSPGAPLRMPVMPAPARPAPSVPPTYPSPGTPADRQPWAAPAPPPAVPPQAPPPVTRPSQPVASPAAHAPSAPGAARRGAGPLRPVNPFLAQDPKQKARRLARALISDMLVYHPEKRQQGMRDGTLPQLFKDEIDKSWQEYVEQVGKELADSTPFWTEALNEILAGGNRVF